MRASIFIATFLFCIAVTAQTEYSPSSSGTEYAETEQDRYYNSKTEKTYIDENELQREADALDFTEVDEYSVEEEKVSEGNGEKQAPVETTLPRNATPPMKSSFGTVFWFIAFAILLIVVVYLIYYFSKKSILLNTENEAIQSVEHLIDKKSLAALKPELALEEALKNRNYRLAVRILFLAMLQKLMQQGKITPSIEKTNMDYVREIDNPNEQKTILELTRIFESVWYGHVPADEVLFRELRSKFDNFKPEPIR